MPLRFFEATPRGAVPPPGGPPPLAFVELANAAAGRLRIHDGDLTGSAFAPECIVENPARKDGKQKRLLAAKLATLQRHEDLCELLAALGLPDHQLGEAAVRIGKELERELYRLDKLGDGALSCFKRGARRMAFLS